MWRLMQCGELWTGVHTLSAVAFALCSSAVACGLPAVSQWRDCRCLWMPAALACACLVIAWLQASHCSPHLTDHIYVACANFVVALALLSLAVVNGFKASQPVA